MCNRTTKHMSTNEGELKYLYKYISPGTCLDALSTMEEERQKHKTYSSKLLVACDF